MTSRLVDLMAAAAVLLAGTPDVPVLSVRTEAGRGQVPGRPRRWAKVKVVAGCYESAERLGGWWGLPEVTPEWSGPLGADGRRMQWRTWTGWVPDPRWPVEVTVTAVERCQAVAAELRGAEVVAS